MFKLYYRKKSLIVVLYELVFVRRNHQLLKTFISVCREAVREVRLMKKNILLIFGGRSSEHEVSCMSAANIADCIDRELYNIVPVGITKEGRWLLCDSLEDIRSGKWSDSETEAVLSPDTTKKELIITDKEKGVTRLAIDVVFPALHGKNGEDGTIQGLFELAEIPYVGCGVLASAVSMDKIYTKIIVKELGIRQADFVAVYAHELSDCEAVADKVEKKHGKYPVFIKPSNAGSSCGVSKAENRQELIEGLKNAAKYDRKILVEEMIYGREIECAAFGDGQDGTVVSGVGEILSAGQFYDYDSKYNNPESRTVTDPELPDGAVETVRDYAKRIFNGVSGYGLSRIDFFVKDDGEVVFNEINTLPGFTAISMYPMLWEARGISKKELVQKLIDSAFARYDLK